MKTRAIKYSTQLASILIVWSVALIGSNFLWSMFLAEKFTEKPWLTYTNLPFPPAVPSVAPGEIIPLIVSYCNNTHEKQNYNTTRVLENVDTQESVLLQEQRSLMKPGCGTSISRLNQIPIGTKDGRYIVYGTSEIRGHVNFVILDWRSQVFTVTSKK